MLSDLRFAVRQLVKSPGFTLLAVVSLALGIGANTAVFSFVNECLLRALPVRAPEQLVIFRTVEGERGALARSINGYGNRDPATGRSSTTSFPLALFERLRTQPAVLTAAFAFSPFWESNILVDGQPEPGVSAQLASGGYFNGLGVPARLGRVFLPEDDRAAAPPVAVISHRFWQRRFGGSPDVLGRTLLLNKVPVTIIGVTPEGFAGAGQVGEHYDVTVPLAQHGRFDPRMQEERQLASTWWVRLMGRLAPGVTREQARAVLEPVFVELAREGWRTAPRAKGETTGEMPGAPSLLADPGYQGEQDNRRRYADSLQLMLGLVGLVLLAACANVANLLLARGAARRREIAVRLALGASRGRIVRQLLAESLLLAGAAAALGTLLAWSARGALLALRPFGNGATNFTLPLDGRVLAFTLGAAVVTALLFGLAPALRATKLDLTREFQGGRNSLGSRSWLSRSLLVLQVALSLLLLVCTGLLVRSLHNLQNVDAGFNRRSLAAFTLNLGDAGYKPAQLEGLRVRLQERLAALPGVAGVVYTQVPLLGHFQYNSAVVIPGITPPGGAGALDANFNAVSPNFFGMTGIPLLLGRAFTAADAAQAPKVAIVNQTFANLYLGGANPIGRRFHYPHDAVEYEIVGLARDAKYSDLRSPVPPTVYLSAAQGDSGVVFFLARTAGDPGAFFPAIRGVVRDIDPTLPVLNLRTMDEQIDRLHGQELLFARLSGFFGVLALALAGVGLYGLMAYVVARRTGEIGLRMALGAMPGQVLRLFLGEAGALVVIGLVFGGFAAWTASGLLTKMLYGLTATDPLTYASAACILFGTALVAAAGPARRAARVDPSEALRAE